MLFNRDATIFTLQKARKAIALQRQWTILPLVESAAGFLAGRGFDEARLHAELLLAHVLHLPRLQLYLQFDRVLTAEEVSRFRTLIERRLRHEPLQYIVGETEFMGFPVKVNPSVLIPRPETEILVERAIEFLKEKESPVVLDVGTGSGNIAIAIARHYPTATVVSVDPSEAALATAAENCKCNNVASVRLVQGNIFEEVLVGEKFDMVVSNPPYVPAEEFAQLQEEVRDFEPEQAVTDGGDGFRVIARIIEFAAGRLNPHGALLMEIGFGQAERVKEMMRQAGYGEIEIYPDYAGIPRVAKGVRYR